MRLSHKTKRVVTLTALGLVCAGCLSLVMIHANAGEEQKAVSSEPSEIVMGTPSPISVPPISSESEASSAFVPSSGAEASEALTESSKPASAPPAPTPPASSELTNKSKKPTYSSKPTASSKVTSKAPSGGKAGEIYVPGFGWQKPTGGQGTTVSGSWGGGEQVGIMD